MQILYLVMVLLMTFHLLTYVHSQGVFQHILHKGWYNTRLINSLNVTHNFVKTGVKHPDYRVNLICIVEILLGLEELFRNAGISTFGCTQTYVNAFGTKQSLCNTVESHFVGLSIR